MTDPTTPGPTRRRCEALHPAPFLIHEDGRIATYRLAKRGSQATYLFGPRNVAREQDEPPRLAFGEKCTVSGRDSRSGNSRDEGPWRHRGELVGGCRKSSRAQLFGTMHWPPAAL